MTPLPALAVSRLALFASCIIALLLQGNTLLRPMFLNDDIAQHHIWLDAGAGSGFNPDDPWVSTSKAIQPYLAAVVFQLLHVALPTLIVGKVLALGILALTGFIIFKLAAHFGSARLGWVAMGLFFISDSWIGIGGGFARAFAWPLVCGFLLAMVSGRRCWAAVCLFLAAALYPIMFVLLVPAYLLLWLQSELLAGGWRQLVDWRGQFRTHWPVMVAVAAGSALVLIKSHELGLHPWVGPQVTLAQIKTDPLYGLGGRVPVWPPSSFVPSLAWALMPWVKGVLEPVLRHAASLPAFLSSGLMLLLNVLAFAIPALAIFLVFRRNRRLAYVLIALALSSVVIYWLAQLLLPKLYEPSRYFSWSMPVLAVLCTAILLEAAVARLPLGRLRQAGWILLVLAMISRAPSIRGKGAEDVSEYSPLYVELARTGGEEIIASFPRTSDFIPLFCHRSVFISNESSHGVLFSRYRDLVMTRHTALLQAFYSPSAAVVRTFCQQHNIRWLVVEDKYYNPDPAPDAHFAPFQQQMRDMLKQTPVPWLLSFARKSGKQVQPGVYLLNTGPILDSTDQP